MKVIGREDLIGDERYSTPAARVERRAEVDELVSSWTRLHDKHTAMRLVGSATIPSGAVLDTREIADDKTFEQRKIRQTMAHPAIGNYVMSGWPVRFGNAPPAVGRAAAGATQQRRARRLARDGRRCHRQIEGRQGDRGMNARYRLDQVEAAMASCASYR